MAKSFERRVAKKDRTTLDLSDRFNRDLFKMVEEGILKGAELLEVSLKEIRVREQVRTKFNDESIKDLARNIETNGLIQPLVLHRDRDESLRLICGERRYRAMSTLQTMEIAPCFILSNKTEEELMAIQFSENQAREELHYIDKADGVLNYQLATNASERKIESALGISKTEVHRSIQIAKLPKALREAAKKFDIEKYVLLEFDELTDCQEKEAIKEKILAGEITKRAALKKEMKIFNLVPDLKRTAKRDLSTDELLRLLASKQGEMDSSAKAFLEQIVKQ